MKQRGYCPEENRKRLSRGLRHRVWQALLCLLILAFAPSGNARALTREELGNIEFRQYPGRQLPLTTGFTNERGASVLLRDYFERKPALPVIFVPGYFRCETLCTGLSDGLIRALQGSRKTAGRDFRVVYVSIDPAEQASAAQARRHTWLQRYGRPEAEAGCAYLRGSAASISELASRIGFDYRYDPETREFAHPAGLLIATPDGRISSYFFGVSFSVGELERALDVAARGNTPSATQRLLMLCFRGYGGSATGDGVIRAVRYLTFGTLVGLALLMVRANRASRSRLDGPHGPQDGDAQG